MRSLQEIDAEIAAVKARMAQRAEGLPTRESPEYRASRFDYVVEGNRQGLDQYQSALQTAMQNKLQRELTASENEKNRQNAMAIAMLNQAEAAAERKQKADELKALKLAQARPEYMKIQKQMLDAVDAGKFDEAAIYQEQLNALNTEHGIGVSKNVETLKQGWEDAREKEAEKRLKVANFLSTIPTTFKNEAEKTPWYEAINNNTDMSTEEKAKEIERIRNIESGSTKVKKAAQGGAASYTGKKVQTDLEDREKGIALARKAKQKKDSGRLLMTDEQEALDKWGGEL